MSRNKLWIEIPNWRKFQHYDPKVRNPPWIKSYTELLSDPNYLGLPPHHRGLLHGIWLLYAASRGEVPASPAYLAHRLGFLTEREARERRARRLAGDSLVTEWRLVGDSVVTNDEDDGDRPVRDRDLKRLEKAGFIALVARDALAPVDKSASPRALAESREEKNKDLRTYEKKLAMSREERDDEDLSKVDYEQLLRQITGAVDEG